MVAVGGLGVLSEAEDGTEAVIGLGEDSQGAGPALPRPSSGGSLGRLLLLGHDGLVDASGES